MSLLVGRQSGKQGSRCPWGRPHKVATAQRHDFEQVNHLAVQKRKDTTTHPGDWHINKTCHKLLAQKKMHIYVTWTDCHGYNLSTLWKDQEWENHTTTNRMHIYVSIFLKIGRNEDTRNRYRMTKIFPT
jgi:hypothetical protein